MKWIAKLSEEKAWPVQLFEDIAKINWKLSGFVFYKLAFERGELRVTVLITNYNGFLENTFESLFQLS